MFKSLDKMVEICDDKLHTLNPFAYTNSVNNNDFKEKQMKEDVPAFPVHIFTFFIVLSFVELIIKCLSFKYLI